MTKTKVICKYDNLPMVKYFDDGINPTGYLCHSRGVFSMHYNKRIVYLNSLPEKTRKRIRKPRFWQRTTTI